jgi:hypothetical protein
MRKPAGALAARAAAIAAAARIRPDDTRRGGALKCGAAASAIALLLAAGIAFPGGGARAEEAPVDPASPLWLYTHDTCRSIYAAAAPDPVAACDCMTPILMRRLTPEAQARIAENPDQLPFGVTLFRDATPEEEAEQRACME